MSKGLGRMKPKRQRLVLVLLGLLFIGGAVAFSLTALNEELDVFRSPSQVAEDGFEEGKRFRVGGIVEDGSIRKAGIVTIFSITDGEHSLEVSYNKILPDLFRHCQGVIALGQLNGQGQFVAQEVLAKHDENYMPPEIAATVKGVGNCEGKIQMSAAEQG
ncbi:MAG: cytochrome c maturation protein CcmE [Minwuia sp.]|uniref:cytochrome c maturation protein CcmE n=1 Tax=Minwuia sp. TaxID=2493630 RepID=UPI003A843188